MNAAFFKRLLAHSKTNPSHKVDADQIWVGTDFGPGTLTASGYARQIKRWKRGTPLASAVTVFEGEIEVPDKP